MTTYRFPEGAALVFGGSGGLGSGIVELLSKCGTDVAFTYLTNKEAADANIARVEANGQKAIAASVDLLEAEKVEDFVNSAKSEFGRIHSVVFATGPFLHILPLLDANPEEVYKTLDTDIKGFYHVLRAAVPVLREGGGGSITALTTAAGVQHLCTAIAREEGHNGIRANCVAVGLIAVGLSQEIDSPPGGILDQWMQQVALGRPGAPEELFDTVVFLASENAGYISGQSLPVDGGYSA